MEKGPRDWHSVHDTFIGCVRREREDAQAWRERDVQGRCEPHLALVRDSEWPDGRMAFGAVVAGAAQLREDARTSRDHARHTHQRVEMLITQLPQRVMRGQVLHSHGDLWRDAAVLRVPRQDEVQRHLQGSGWR